MTNIEHLQLERIFMLIYKVFKLTILIQLFNVIIQLYQLNFSIICNRHFFSSSVAKEYFTDNLEISFKSVFLRSKCEATNSNSFDKVVLKTPLSSV